MSVRHVSFELSYLSLDLEGWMEAQWRLSGGSPRFQPFFAVLLSPPWRFGAVHLCSALGQCETAGGNAPSDSMAGVHRFRLLDVFEDHGVAISTHAGKRCLMDGTSDQCIRLASQLLCQCDS